MLEQKSEGENVNAKTREKMLYIGFFVQKLGDIIDDEKEPSKTLQMAYNGVRSYFNKAVERMTPDEKLKLKTDMERKYIQIDYRKTLDFKNKAYRSQVLIEADELCVLAGYAIDYACRFCDRDAEEQNNCMLRETLIRCNAVEGVDLAKKRACPYRNMGAKEIVAEADQRLHDAWTG